MTDTRLLIEGMHCGSCAARIENALTALDGVTSASVNFATMIGAVRHDSAKTSVDTLCDAVRSVGFTCSLQRSTAVAAQSSAISRERLEANAVDDVARSNAAQSSCCLARTSREDELSEMNSITQQTPTTAAGDNDETLLGEDSRVISESMEEAAVAMSTTVPLQYAFLIEGMSCASCAARIESTVAQTFKDTDLFRFALSFSTCMAKAQTPSADAFEALCTLIESLGYHARNAHRLHSPSTKAASSRRDHSSTHTYSAATAVRVTSPSHHETAAEEDRSARDATRHALERQDEIANQKKYFLLSAVLAAPLLLIMLLMSFTSLLHTHTGVTKAIDVGQFLLTTPIVLYCGRQFFVRAWASWQHGAYTMDTLVALGTGCSYVYSVVALLLSLLTSSYVMPYFDTAGMLTCFMLLGRYLEARAKRSTSGALLALMSLIPSEATVLQPDGSTVRVRPEEVEVGMRVRVIPGERVPVDGTVVEGITEVDEQMLTGESLPKTVKPGKRVVGGTLNVGAVVVVVADKVGADTMLAQILRITEEAQNAKPAVQRIADAVAMRFVPAVVGLAVATLVVWLLLGAFHAYPDAWLTRRGGDADCEGTHTAGEETRTSWVGFAFNFFIATVVAACPCALGLATPTAIMVGTGVGANNGLLVKSGVTLEGVRMTKCVLLDKTGTITRGELSVVNAELLQLPGQSPQPQITPSFSACCAAALSTAEEPTKDKTSGGDCGDGAAAINASPCRWTADCVRAVVCEVEGQSPHPIAKAIHKALAPRDTPAADTQTRHTPSTAVLSAANKSGRGMVARVRMTWPALSSSSSSSSVGDVEVGTVTEHTVLVGNMKLLLECGVPVADEARRLADAHLSHGLSVVWVAIDRDVCMLFSLADEPKPEAAKVIAALHARGLHVKMVTGDHALVAARIAIAVGLDPHLDVVAEALPADKAAVVRQCQDTVGPVLFVGDGINDSPALAAANVGVALGAGTEIAMEAADAVLVRSSLVDLLNLFALSNTTVRHIYGNFVWAFAYNLVMLPLACGILYPLWHVQVPPVLAGIAMVLSSLSVLMSSLSVKLFKPYSENMFI